jgi:hypothetical protein
MSDTVVHVKVEARGVSGEVAIVVAPGTKADAQKRLLDRALATTLEDAASSLSAVLVAAPHAYAFVQPGKDDQGRTRFVVSGALEGDRLVPIRPGRA